MKVLLSLLLSALVLPAWAAKHTPTYDYQNATLVALHEQAVGSSCSHSSTTNGTVDATTNDDGYTNGTVNSTSYGSSNCSDDMRWLYTVKTDENTFVLTPDHSGKVKTGAVLSMGWSAMFVKASVLANRLPGTKVLIRSDGKHIYVKLDKRESMYSIVEAR